MKLPQLIAAEIRRLFSTKMGVVALIALLTVPILYGGLYLWANQDPYGKLDEVPVALVVSDQGATIDDESRNLGDEVADELIDDGTFAWHRVSESQATRGLDEGTYDFAVEIPKDFSASVASIAKNDPHPADLVLRTNDANNYLASTIGTSAIETIQRSVTEKIVAESGLTMLDALSTVRVNLVDATNGATQIVDGLATAQRGTGQLADGAGRLADGTGSLVDGSQTLANGAGELSSGASRLADGSAQISDGASRLADGTAQVATGADQLVDGTARVADGAASLADGTSQLATGAVTLADGAQQVADGTGQLATAADALGSAAGAVGASVTQARTDIETRLRATGLTDAQVADVLAQLDPIGEQLTATADSVSTATGSIDQLSTGAQQVSAGAGQLREKLQEASAGAAQLRDGAQTAATGATQLRAGAHSAADGAAGLRDATATAASGASALSSGASRVSDGASPLATGATALDDGALQLKGGIGDLSSGLDKLHDGAGELESGLSDGTDKLPDSDQQTRQKQADTLGAPVSTEKDAVNAAENYGAGLAPFFAALAAWIGVYALFLIVKPISRRAVTALNAPMRVTLAGWATPALLGAVQMVGLFAILSITLGFDFANPWGALGMLVFASATYTAIILALNVWLGSVGQFLGLILMVLQLVTAGGTFPWQTLPAPLAALHHVLPMGYVVDAMRQIMYGGGWDRIGGDLTVLLAWLVGAVAIAALGVARMTRSRTLRDLQPSLIG